MARVEYGAFITSLKGSIGGVSFHRNTSGDVAKIKPSQVFRQSTLQTASQIIFSQFRSIWSTLSSATQTLWNTFASLHTRVNYFEETKILTGYNWFLSININANICGAASVPTPPAYTLPANPSAFMVIISPTHIFILFLSAYVHDVVYLFAFFTMPIRSQSLLNRSKIRLIKVMAPASSLDYDCTSEYIASFNIPSVPFSTDSGAKLLCSIAAIHQVSFIASAFTSSIGEIPPNTAALITTGFNGDVRRIRKQSDGKIICVGNFTSYNSTTRNRICRLNTDLSLDSTFDPDSGFNAYVQDCYIDVAGTILCVGTFTSFRGASANYIKRLTSTGSADATFVVGTGFNAQALCVIGDESGYYFVGGDFTTFKGTGSNRIVKLDSVGTIDATFNVGTGFNARVSSIAYKLANSLKVGGNFTSYAGTGCNYIVALLSNGAIDGTFLYGTGFNGQVTEIAFNSSTSVYVVGDFTTYKGASNIRIILIDNVGTKAAVFITDTGLNVIAYGILVTFNDFVLVCGLFTTYKGITIHKILRIRPDGSPDYSFLYPTTSTGNVFSIIETINDKILLGGSFTALGSISKNRICRLFRDGTTNN